MEEGAREASEVPCARVVPCPGVHQDDAVRRAEATSQEKMAGLTAGLPLPPGFKMPF